MMSMNLHLSTIRRQPIDSAVLRLGCALILGLAGSLPVHSDGSTVQLPTADGVLAVYWYGAPDATATIILGHGYLDHGRGNQQVIDHFLGKGFSVLAWDLPGHGNSWGQPGAIDDFMQYARAFDAVLFHAREMRPADTLSFIGHSTSCAVFLTWQREFWNTGLSSLAGVASATGSVASATGGISATTGNIAFPLERVVLVAPLVRTWLYRLSGFGWWVGRCFIRDFKPRTSAGSHRPGYGKEFFADPLTVKRMPASWIAPYREWEVRTRSWEPDPFPLLIIQGRSDTALDWRYNIRFLTEVYPATRVELIEGGWHCLLEEAEPWVSQVYGILDREF